LQCDSGLGIRDWGVEAFVFNHITHGSHDEFSRVYDERVSRRWGYCRKVVGEVVEEFQACGILPWVPSNW